MFPGSASGAVNALQYVFRQHPNGFDVQYVGSSQSSVLAEVNANLAAETEELLTLNH